MTTDEILAQFLTRMGGRVGPRMVNDPDIVIDHKPEIGYLQIYNTRTGEMLEVEGGTTCKRRHHLGTEDVEIKTSEMARVATDFAASRG